MSDEVSLDGLEETLRALSAIPDEVTDAVKRNMERWATRIVAMMKRLAPVLKESRAGRRAGALRDSIGWTWGEPPQGSVALMKVGDANEAFAITIYAGSAETIVTNARGVEFQNAKLQEFGTKAVPATPYFYPAWRANKDGFRRGERSAVRRAVKKLFAEHFD